VYELTEIIAEVTEKKDVGESAISELDEKKDSTTSSPRLTR